MAALAGPARVLVLALALVAASTIPAQRETRVETSALYPAAASTVKTNANHFLSRYVTSDGRVLRLDQGGDIVSEGQAYGMLLAASVNDDLAFRRIWAWTKGHLQRPDGLISWHASGSGEILDTQAATDADLLIAWALLRYTGSRERALHDEGRRIADAVLLLETTTVNGAAVPLAGPWAISDLNVNPSYWMPCVTDDLASLTGNAQWSAMRREMTHQLSTVTDGGNRLPPDWGRIVDGSLQATGSPDGDAAPRHGPDAERIPIFFADGPTQDQRSLSAAWWPTLKPEDRSGALVLNLDGSVSDSSHLALAYVASSFSARAAKEYGDADRLMAQADAHAQKFPTYYGDAWVALGDAMLGGRLGPCRPA
jgi:endoglucanase